MLTFLLLLIATTLLSTALVLAALLLAVRKLSGASGHRPRLEQPLDPFVAAAIDREAVRWATEHGHPEAAPLVSAKLRLLQRLGEHRSRS